MKKRWISTILCAMMAIGSLAGCGLKNPDTAATAAPVTAEAPATGATKTKGSTTEETKTGAAADTSDVPEATLVMAKVSPLDTIVGQADSKSKETVKETSGDKIKIDLQVGGILGSENDILGTILGDGGTTDTSRVSAFILTSYGAGKSMLLSTPHAFTNRSHFWKFADSDLVPELLMGSHDSRLGMRDLYYGEKGFRRFFIAKEVKDLDDSKGMKLHVSNDPIMDGIVEGLGVGPTVVSFNELHSALQTGIVGSAEQPATDYSSNAFREATPNLILDGHTLDAVQIIITDEAWDELAGEQQNTLVEAGKVTSQFNKTIPEKVENKVLEELKADGINVVEVSDVKPWQDTCEDIIESSTKGQVELYQQTFDMNE